jgi:hypothetical protein
MNESLSNFGGLLHLPHTFIQQHKKFFNRTAMVRHLPGNQFQGQGYVLLLEPADIPQVAISLRHRSKQTPD